MKLRHGIFYQMKKMTVPLIMLLSVFILSSAIFGSFLYLGRHELLQQARKELLKNRVGDAVKMLYYSDEIIKERILILQEYKISVFREQK